MPKVQQSHLSGHSGSGRADRLAHP